jgi:hypothetical protein
LLSAATISPPSMRSVASFGIVLLLAAPRVDAASATDDIALPELVRRSERIVVGHVTRVLQIRRTHTTSRDLVARKWSIENENGWSVEPTVPIAEVEVERTLKGRPVTDKVYYFARNVSTADATRAVLGERAFFFLSYDERLGWEDRRCVTEFMTQVGWKNRLCDLVHLGRGRMTIVGSGSDAFVRCPRDVRCGVNEVSFDRDSLTSTRTVPYSLVEAEVEHAIERQMPIFHAYDSGYTHDRDGAHASNPWELWVFGDGVCRLRVSTLRELDREFDRGSGYVSWLTAKFEREGFQRMPELIGPDAPDTSGASLEWMTSDASRRVFITSSMTITPATNDLTRGALRLLIAMRNTFEEPLAFDDRDRLRKLLGEKP